MSAPRAARSCRNFRDNGERYLVGKWLRRLRTQLTIAGKNQICPSGQKNWKSFIPFVKVDPTVFASGGKIRGLCCSTSIHISRQISRRCLHDKYSRTAIQLYQRRPSPYLSMKTPVCFSPPKVMKILTVPRVRAGYSWALFKLNRAKLIRRLRGLDRLGLA